jgi:hypothetical protein
MINSLTVMRNTTNRSPNARQGNDLFFAVHVRFQVLRTGFAGRLLSVKETFLSTAQAKTTLPFFLSVIVMLACSVRMNVPISWW